MKVKAKAKAKASLNVNVKAKAKAKANLSQNVKAKAEAKAKGGDMGGIRVVPIPRGLTTYVRAKVFCQNISAHTAKNDTKVPK